MAKRTRKPVKVEKVNPQPIIINIGVVFNKDFEGQLNNWKVNAKKGDALEVLPFQAEWLKKFGVI